MAYYENPKMLEVQAEVWRALPEHIKVMIKIVLVDDGSPRNPAVLPKDIGIPITLYRVGVDVRWNQDAARNIGVEHSDTEWILLTDMDHVVPADTWEWIIRRPLQQNVCYTFRRLRAPDMVAHKSHPNSWLMTRVAFRRVWYDERFAGYYGTDGDFKDRLVKVVKLEELKGQLITFPREVIPDASTVDYTRKELYDFENVKRIRRERGSQKPLTLTFPYQRIASA